MKLNPVALATTALLSCAMLSPAVAASTAAATATAAKPAMMAAKTPDPKRFATEAAAKASCSTDTVVWANLRSKIYHLKGTATYGKGKHGVYMCTADATSEGFKPTKKPEKQVSSK
jgi:hypothetical protein